MTTIEDKFHALITTVEAAGQVARDYFDSDDFSNTIKDDGSAVTHADEAIEKILREYVDTHFPEDSIIGEEQEDKVGTSGFVWHIDPIDGTDNFLRKVPFCAISVARLGDTTEDSFAVVHNPITKHTFASLMENCVYENKRVTNLTEQPLGGKFTIAFGRGKETWMKKSAYKFMEVLGTKYGRCQPYNCTALELAYVSADRIDAFLTYGLKSYDYAAGLFLNRAAGAKISVFEQGEWNLYTGSLKSLCATHGKTIFVSVHP